MIRLSGYSEDDIRIEFTGMRPGEKLYEELLAESWYCWTRQRISRIYAFRQETGLRLCRVIGRGNTAFASTTSGACVSAGRQMGLRTSRLSITTERRPR